MAIKLFSYKDGFHFKMLLEGMIFKKIDHGLPLPDPSKPSVTPKLVLSD
ncbi:MAG: hypothetical protein AAF489_00770 [Bacteroidota bacterium]